MKITGANTGRTSVAEYIRVWSAFEWKAVLFFVDPHGYCFS